ncbi:MAG: ribonuclease E/G, partial [Proteobacteria bacterium]|nr:ribonuclease E/G [Pseudomonadota bacterium]
ILKIENRHRVTVILIPNKHLETPHYKLERIKHDDPRLDDKQASYKMAEEVETDIGYNKAQKEEVKPRQEAMVKGITPDQPAPLVERKPEAVVAAAPVVTVSEQGFFGKLMGFFFKKPAEPIAAPTAPASKSPQSRERNERHDRNGNGGRNRRGRGGRGNRERGEERDTAGKNEQRSEAQTRNTSAEAATASGNRQQQPRQPREAQEGRRERQPRNRDERKEAQAAVKTEEPVLANDAAPLLAAAAVATAGFAAAETIADNTEAQVNTNGPDAEGGEQNEEQRRRRRRRGGRNRNRREREEGEGAETGESEHSVEASDGETAIAIAANTTVEDAQPMAVTEAVAPVTTHQVTEPVAVAAALTPAPIVAASTPTPIVAPTPVATAPVVAAPSAVAPAAIVAQAPMPLDELRTVLSAAGLTLAVTDPDKLRVAQEAAAMIVPTPRVPRVRKPLPPLSTEPLIQVETRH